MTDHLRRSQAPLSDAAWEAVEEEAARTLEHFLAARPVVDVSEAHGWEEASVSTGRVDRIESDVEGVEARRRRVLPYAELRRPFVVPHAELEAIDRGAGAPDLEMVSAAARAGALAEDRALFGGWAAAGFEGIATSSPHEPVVITPDYAEYPSHVAKGVAALRRAGVGGPYALALGPRCYTGVIEGTANGGYPVLEHIRLILGGPIIWAPAVDGAVLVSRRGGDYELHLGQDWSIGFHREGDDGVELYLEESFAFEVLEPAAAVALRYL